MTKPIAEQVAEVKIGDWVEARFEHKDGRVCVFTNKLQGRKPYPKQLEFPNVIIRYSNGLLNSDLTSITRVPRPIPSEPEVGSFALLKNGSVTQLGIGTSGKNWFSERIALDNHSYLSHYSWPEIYPHITRLYTPSGDEVTGFEYYKSEGN